MYPAVNWCFGKTVQSYMFSGPSANIEVSSLVAGFYFAEVINEEGQ